MAVADGFFVPLSLDPTPTAWQVAEELGRLGLPAGCTVYLRGSRLEDEHPHPAADLDLVVVVDGLDRKRATWQVLAPWAARQVAWPVDLVAYATSQVARAPEIRLLLATRSHRLTGPPLDWAAVAADDATMRDHAARYAPHLVPPIIRARGHARVCQLKLVTRSFGVWGFDAGMPFSRDIATCLQMARTLAPAAAAALEAAWRSVDGGDPLDVTEARAALMRHRWFAQRQR